MITFGALAQEAGIPIWLLLVVIAWNMAWKAAAWWKSARNSHLIWFILFFFVHTFGILEILYIFLFSKIRLPKTPKHKKYKRR